MSDDHGAVQVNGEIYAYDIREPGPQDEPPMVTLVGGGQPAMKAVPDAVMTAIEQDRERQRAKQAG